MPSSRVATKHAIEVGLDEADFRYTVRHVPVAEWSDEVVLEVVRRLQRLG